MFKKIIVFFGVSFICIAQKSENLTVSVDSTVVRIGTNKLFSSSKSRY